MADTSDKVYFAEADFRNKRTRFGIKLDDRLKHAYVIGKTGMGKTTLLENMAIQDIQDGRGIGIVDPHGEFAEKMLDYVPKERIKDVLYFSPSDVEAPIGFNIIENVADADKRHLIADGLMGVFKKIWADMWSARMEYILGNTVLALLEYPGATLLDINRMLAVKEYRQKVVEKVTDPIVKSFWVEEFAKYTDRYTAEATPAIQNKVGQFTANPLIRNIVGQKKSAFDIRKLMDEQKIFIMNLSKGKIGEENANLIGAMLVTKIYLAAMSRVDVPSEERTPFYLYVDEFQNFATASFASILSESRKYGLSLTLAHQYIAQMDEKTRDAVVGNVGTHIVFRVGAPDAEFLEKEFKPEFFAQNLVNLPFANVYLKLMIDGVTSRPFSAMTIAPIGKPEQNFKEEIIKFSREHYGTTKQEVEAQIKEWIDQLATQRQEEAAKKISPTRREPSRRRDEAPTRRGMPRRRDDEAPKSRASDYRPKMDIKAGKFVGRMEQEGEKAKPLSLRDLSAKRPSKGPELNELRAALKESLQKNKEDEDEKDEGNNKKSGSLKPGESIKFD